jgi:hypothetical protein
MNKIKFHSHRTYNDSDQNYRPAPSSSVIPEWFAKADKHEISEMTGEPIVYADGKKHPTFKACPALIDIFLSGYMLRTPCDIKFGEKDGQPGVATAVGYEGFCKPRRRMKIFPVPEGYYEDHFHWSSNWAPETPDGYSAIYSHPFNRFDLPFITVGGIIDNDKMNTPGNMPFFLRKGFTGELPAGTPFAQIIPFKREDWEMDFELYTQEEITNRHKRSKEVFRTPEGGGYKKHVWSRKKYK